MASAAEEIGSSIAEIARQVSHSKGIAGAAVAASNVLQLAKALGTTADTLRGEVEGFLVEIRAA